MYVKHNRAVLTADNRTQKRRVESVNPIGKSLAACLGVIVALTVSFNTLSTANAASVYAYEKTIPAGSLGSPMSAGRSASTRNSTQVETVVFSDSDFLSGSGSAMNRLELRAGEYRLKLSDYAMGSMLGFSNLVVSLSTASEIVTSIFMKKEETQAYFNFDLARSGSYYMTIYGIAADGISLGAYGVELSSISYVPLPAAAGLLASGLAFMGFIARRRGKRSSEANVQPRKK